MNQAHIDQYVSGRMSESEAEAFEVYCLENPDFARQVEFEQRLKAGLAEVGRGSTAEFVRAERPTSWKIAAGLGAVLAAGLLFHAWQNHARPGASMLAAVTTASERSGPGLRLALVRGAESLPALPAGKVRLEIVGLFDADATYVVSLDRLEESGARTLATLADERPVTNLSLEVMLEGDALAPGTYSLRVRRQGSAEEPLVFGFVKN